jgi:hypothetical protein
LCVWLEDGTQKELSTGDTVVREKAMMANIDIKAAPEV